MKSEQITELTKIAYNRTADKYHASFKNEIEQKEYDRSLLDCFSGLLPNGSLILDAGCGPSGHLGKYLSRNGHKIVGIDISQRCIDIATVYNPEITFKVMDIANTDFKNDSFDGILSFYSIIYTPKKYMNAVFKEFNRILRQGGILLLVVKKGMEEGIMEEEWYEGNKVYFTYFLEDEIKDYFATNHFMMDYLNTRKPYDFEIQVDRIYAIGTKIN